MSWKGSRGSSDQDRGFYSQLGGTKSRLALLAYIGIVEKQSGKQQVFTGAEQHKLRERLGAMAVPPLYWHCLPQEGSG